MINQLYNNKQWYIICVTTLIHLGATDGYAAEEFRLTKVKWNGREIQDEKGIVSIRYSDIPSFSIESRLSLYKDPEWNILNPHYKDVQKRKLKSLEEELIEHTAAQLLYHPHLYDYASHKQLYRRDAIERIDSSKELSTVNEDICITKKYKKYISLADTKCFATCNMQTNESIRLHKTILEAETINFTLGKCLLAQQCYLLANRLIIKSINKDRSLIQTIDMDLDKDSKPSIEGVIDFHNNTTTTEDDFFKFGENERLVISGIKSMRISFNTPKD